MYDLVDIVTSYFCYIYNVVEFLWRLIIMFGQFYPMFSLVLRYPKFCHV
jgi:hypothetical protein